MRRCSTAALRVVLVVVLTVGAACTGGIGPDASDGGAVRIGSFDFAESELVAELYAQLLEAGGVPVERVGAVGPREVVAPALQQGLLDLVPEYLGSATEYFGAASEHDLPAALASRDLMLLAPALAQDVNVVVVTDETAERFGLVSISDLADVAPRFRLAGPAECPDRPHCLLGLEDVYGLTFGSFVPLRNLAVTADALRRGEVEVGIMFSTSAELTSGAFTVLDDDLALQPSERIVPVATTAAARRWPLGEILDPWSARLGTTDLQVMNRRLQHGETATDVVASWIDATAPR